MAYPYGVTMGKVRVGHIEVGFHDSLGWTRRARSVDYQSNIFLRIYGHCRRVGRIIIDQVHKVNSICKGLFFRIHHRRNPTSRF